MLAVRYRTRSHYPQERTICTIVHEDFLERLEASFQVAPLMPGCLLESLEMLIPDIVVIHRNAFDTGAWFGAESPYGQTLREELKLIGEWSVGSNTEVIVVDNGLPEGCCAGLLEDIGTSFFPNRFFSQRSTEGASRSLIYWLAEEYAEDQLDEA